MPRSCSSRAVFLRSCDLSSSSGIVYALTHHHLLPSPAVIAPTGPDSNNSEMAHKTARAGWRAIGERVEALRRARGWNRTSLAARAEVTVTTIRGCEEGTKVTQPDKLRAIAKALGVPMSRLEVDEKDPRVKQWNDEDYEIGNWYHNAPRAMKNRIWALQELTDAAAALTDPLFQTLLATWPALTPYAEGVRARRARLDQKPIDRRGESACSHRA